MQITQICKKWENRDSFDRACRRHQLSSRAVRSVPATTVRGYNDLCDIEHGVIDGTREMG